MMWQIMPGQHRPRKRQRIGLTVAGRRVVDIPWQYPPIGMLTVITTETEGSEDVG
jgi:hypothetical protein